MAERSFAFLTCLGCEHFVPKNPAMPDQVHGATLVGFCWCEGRVQQVNWRSLERAVRASGHCPDRAPGLFAEPRCSLFEATAESATRPYPNSCVYYGMAVCPLSPPRDVIPIT